MKRFAIAATASLAALALVTTASAGTVTGTTTLLTAPVAGSTVDVDVAAVSEIPVVPYEYTINNACNFAGKPNGRPDSTQRDPIVNWVYSDPSNTVPHAIMPVYLNNVPAGSLCRVYLMRNNQVVKGSTTTYTVQ